jgi:hypothetical protein
MTYEPPTIEERTKIGDGLIGAPIGSVPISPAWRRSEDEQEDA